jgi:PAT family beta-lactamase induction signal transducer AmpG
VMLARFVPPGVREPEFSVEDVPQNRPPLSALQLAVRGAVGAVLMGVAALALVALLAALKTLRDTPAAGFDFTAAMRLVAHPAGIAEWIQLVSIAVFAIVGGLFVAAASAARRGTTTTRT